MELLKMQILFILHKSNNVLNKMDQILFKFVSIASLVGAWAIQQASEVNPIVSQGFDQLFSIGLLIVAVIVIWKAFSKKDENETQLLKERADLYQRDNEIKQKLIDRQQTQIDTLNTSVERLTQTIEAMRNEG